MEMCGKIQGNLLLVREIGIGFEKKKHGLLKLIAIMEVFRNLWKRTEK